RTLVPVLASCDSYSTLLPPPRSPLFPYTTLFRSRGRIPGFLQTLQEAKAVQARHIEVRQDHVGRKFAHLLESFISVAGGDGDHADRKSTRLNSSHEWISYAVFCLKKKNKICSHTR